MTDVRDMAALLRALGDPTRLRILGLLLAGEVCVCHLHESLRIPQPRASRHLAYLRRAGLVETRRDGLWIYYRLATFSDPVQAADCCRRCARPRARAERSTRRRAPAEANRLRRARAERRGVVLPIAGDPPDVGRRAFREGDPGLIRAAMARGSGSNGRPAARYCCQPPPSAR